MKDFNYKIHKHNPESNVIGSWDESSHIGISSPVANAINEVISISRDLHSQTQTTWNKHSSHPLQFPYIDL